MIENFIVYIKLKQGLKIFFLVHRAIPAVEQRSFFGLFIRTTSGMAEQDGYCITTVAKGTVPGNLANIGP
jgi:hypothetical protein